MIDDFCWWWWIRMDEPALRELLRKQAQLEARHEAEQSHRDSSVSMVCDMRQAADSTSHSIHAPSQDHSQPM